MKIVLFLFVLLILNFCGTSEIKIAQIQPNYQDTALLEKAWNLPVSVQFKKHFEYQKNITFCGPASVENTLYSIGNDKLNQSNLFDEEKMSFSMKVRTQGMTLDEIGDFFQKKSGKKVKVVRDISYNEFLAHIKNSNDLSKRIIINFHRKPLFGKGGGHHSPIGGYLEKENLVFVLDVNETYKPFLINPERLYESIDTIDSENNKKRGLIIIEAK